MTKHELMLMIIKCEIRTIEDLERARLLAIAKADIMKKDPLCSKN